MSEQEYQKMLAANPELVVQGADLRHAITDTGVSEHDHQVALFVWADANLDRYPVLRWMHAIPNGGKRHPAVGGKMKAEGLKSGVPDICLPIACHGFHALYIEMKVGKNKPRDEQPKWIEYLRGAGYCVRLCYSAKDAQKAIEEYLNG